MLKKKFHAVYAQVRAHKFVALLVFLLGVNTIVNIIAFAFNKADSDFVSFFLLGEDFFKSNIFLPANSYLFKLPYYFLALDWFGYSVGNLVFLNILNALFLFGCFFICFLYFVRQNPIRNKYSSLAVLLPCFLLVNQSDIVGIFYRYLMHPFCRNAELGIFFFLIFSRFRNNNSYLGSLFMLVLMIVLFISDPYWIFVFGLPFVVSIMLIFVAHRSISKQNVFFLYYLVIAIFTSLLLWVVLGQSEFFTVYSKGAYFVPWQNFGNNFRLLGEGLLRLFGIWLPVGVSLSSWQGFSLILNIMIVGISLVGIIHLFADKLKAKDSSGIFLSVCFVLTICSYVFSSLPKNLDTTRYLIVLPFLLVFGLYYFLQKFRFNSKVSLGIYLLLILAVPLHIINASPDLRQIPSREALYQDNYAVINALKQEDLDYGYAEFGDAVLNTYLAQNKIKIRQVTYWFGQVAPYEYIASKSWYDPQYHEGWTFLLLRQKDLDQKVGLFTFEQLLPRQFGQPLKVRVILTREAVFKLFIYDHNISKNFVAPQKIN